MKTTKKLNIPDKPGVYFFIKNKQILYIGKATSLRDRIKSYFGKDLIGTRGPILVDMVFNADKINWQVSDSVLEAIILEANLIKKHQPKYNTKEKSDKSFNYVCITREKLPKVVIMRGSNVKHRVLDKIYGPYTNGTQLREAMKVIRKIFPFLDDKSKNYMEFYKQINLVPDLQDRTMYLQNIRNIKLFFAGKKKKILQNLKKQMKEYAKLHEFEKAGEIKRQIFALQHINDVALLKLEPSVYGLEPMFRIEAYDIAHMSGKNMVGVMTVIEDGQVAKSEYKRFSARGGSAFGGKTLLGNNGANDTGALAEILERRLEHREWSYPNLIVVDGGVAQQNTAKLILKKHKINITVASVVKDDKHKPKAILGEGDIIKKHKSAILLANSEAHRFAINYHKNMRSRNFLR